MIGQPLAPELQQKLARKRQMRGWTVTDLAREADISVTAARRACTGRPITGRVMQAIAVAVASTESKVLPEVRELFEGAA